MELYIFKIMFTTEATDKHEKISYLNNEWKDKSNLNLNEVCELR